MPLGFSLPLSKTGLKNVIHEASLYGLDAVQIRFGNTKTWSHKKLTPSETEDFRATRENQNIKTVMALASPLISLAHPGEIGKMSVHALAQDLFRAGQIGAEHLRLEILDGLPENYIEGILEAKKLAKSNVQILLQNGYPYIGVIASRLESIQFIASETKSALCLDIASAEPGDIEKVWHNVKALVLQDYSEVPTSRMAPIPAELGQGIYASKLEGVCNSLQDALTVFLGLPRGLKSDSVNLGQFRRWTANRRNAG